MGLRAGMLQLAVSQAEAEGLGAASESKRSVSERAGRGRCLLGEAGEAMLELGFSTFPTLVAGAGGMGALSSHLSDRKEKGPHDPSDCSSLDTGRRKATLPPPPRPLTLLLWSSLNNWIKSGCN
jgi:hypothetical protein